MVTIKILLSESELKEAIYKYISPELTQVYSLDFEKENKSSITFEKTSNKIIAIVEIGENKNV